MHDERQEHPTFNGLWTIDNQREQVTYSGEPPITATILQMLVGLLRDDNGNVVELEVLYLCETPEGHQFVLDDSQPCDENSC
jgi:hypothetical protein